MADPHFAAREMVVPVEQPGIDRPVHLAGEAATRKVRMPYPATGSS